MKYRENNNLSFVICQVATSGFIFVRFLPFLPKIFFFTWSAKNIRGATTASLSLLCALCFFRGRFREFIFELLDLIPGAWSKS